MVKKFAIIQHFSKRSAVLYVTQGTQAAYSIGEDFSPTLVTPAFGRMPLLLRNSFLTGSCVDLATSQRIELRCFLILVGSEFGTIVTPTYCQSVI